MQPRSDRADWIPAVYSGVFRIRRASILHRHTPVFEPLVFSLQSSALSLFLFSLFQNPPQSPFRKGGEITFSLLQPGKEQSSALAYRTGRDLCSWSGSWSWRNTLFIQESMPDSRMRITILAVAVGLILYF